MRDPGNINVELMLAAFANGQLPHFEAELVENMVTQDENLRNRVELLRDAACEEALETATSPPFGSRGKVVFRAMMEGEMEAEKALPIIHSRSRISDFENIISNELERLLKLAESFAFIQIGATKDTNSFLVKMETEVRQEVHMNEIERVLVLQGNCILYYGDRKYELGPGDSFVLASNVPHTAKTSSDGPCIFICQRTTVSN